MDAVSVHPYVFPYAPETALGDLQWLKSTIASYNVGTKPMWITEQGWPTSTDGNGVSEATQAKYLVRAHVIALSQGVEQYYWYDFMNDGNNAGSFEDNQGLVRNTNDAAGKWTPKPAYVSYAVMTRQLTGTTYSGQDQVGSGINSYRFNNGATDIRTIWTTSSTSTVTVVTSDPIIVTDMMGTATTYYPQGGRISLSLPISGDPVYVTGNNIQITL